jgi:hypothetical protein
VPFDSFKLALRIGFKKAGLVGPAQFYFLSTLVRSDQQIFTSKHPHNVLAACVLIKLAI